MPSYVDVLMSRRNLSSCTLLPEFQGSSQSAFASSVYDNIKKTKRVFFCAHYICVNSPLFIFFNIYIYLLFQEKPRTFCVIV